MRHRTPFVSLMVNRWCVMMQEAVFRYGKLDDSQEWSVFVSIKLHKSNTLSLGLVRGKSLLSNYQILCLVFVCDFTSPHSFMKQNFKKGII